MCRHGAAVLYGAGARLDERPELLFVLRGVDHTELIAADAAKAVTAKSRKAGRKTLTESELSDVFGIDMAPSVPEKKPAAAKQPKPAKPAARAVPAHRASSAKTKSRQARSLEPQPEPAPAPPPKPATARKTVRKKQLAN
jgi:uncharacterized Zn finger protein